MSGGGGGGGDTTTTIKPWGGAEGALLNSFKRANNLYLGEAGFNPLLGSGGVQNFQDTLGFDPRGGNAYGIDPGHLTTGAITGVNPLNALQRAGQQRMVDVANQPPSSMITGAHGYLSAAMDDGRSGQNTLRGMATGWGQETGNPYHDRATNMTGFASGQTGIGPNKYMDRTQGALADAAAGKYLDDANRNPYMDRTNSTLAKQSSGEFIGETNAADPFLWKQQQSLTDAASGKFLDDSNPYLEGQYQAASRGLKDDFKTSVLPALAAQFSGGAGAHGSPDHQYWAGKAGGDLTDTLGDMRANMFGSQYGQERDRMLSAGSQLQGADLQRSGQFAGNLQNERGMQLQAGGQLQGADLQRMGQFSQNFMGERNNMLGAAGQLQSTDMQRAGLQADMRNADLNRQFGAGQQLLNRDMTQAGQYASTRDANLNRMVGAAGQLAGAGMQGAGMLPQLDQQMYDRQLQGAQLLGQAGDMDYNIANQLTGQAQQRYDQLQAEPWGRLGAYTNTVYGNPASGMTSQGAAGAGGGGSPLMGAAGGALGGAAAGSMFGPWGMLGGALLGGGAGFF